MRFIIIVTLIRWFIALITWFVKVCFQVGVLLGSGAVSLFNHKKPGPQVDASKNANSVRPLRDE